MVSIEDNTGAAVQYVYDERSGKITREQTRTGETEYAERIYKYDIYGRRTEVTDPLGNTEHYRYDEEGAHHHPCPTRRQTAQNIPTP